jgi:hypothetical protein
MTTSYDVLGAEPGTALAPAWRPRRRDLATVVVGPDEVTAAFAAAAACSAERRGGQSSQTSAAADPLVLPLLVGAGLRSFSVGVARLGDVRESLRGLDVRACVDVFDQALSLSDESAVQRLVASALRTSHAC